MFIETEGTPNPATLKFLPGREVMPSGTADFAGPDLAGRSPLAQSLFALPGVARVFLGGDFVTVTKSDLADWAALRPQVLGAVMEHFVAERPVIEGSGDAVAEDVAPEDQEVVDQIKDLLDTRVRPAVAGDGGDIVFRGYRDGVVRLHMQGACSGCPSSSATLKHGIENMLRHYVPEVVSVEQVEFLIHSDSLDTLFRTARTHYRWLDQPVSDDELRAVYDLMKMGPTSANSSPARFMFLRTPAAKERLRPALSAGNVDKAMAAPVVAIVATDPEFYEQLPYLYPQADARSWFAGNDELANATASRNGTLQGAYLIMAARAAGLDCGPMSGFDNERVDTEFLASDGWKSNFLVCLGHGDPADAGQRAPRLGFDEACRLL